MAAVTNPLDPARPAPVKPIASVPSPVVNPIVRPAPMSQAPAAAPAAGKPAINVASVGGSMLPAPAPAPGAAPGGMTGFVSPGSLAAGGDSSAPNGRHDLPGLPGSTWDAAHGGIVKPLPHESPGGGGLSSMLQQIMAQKGAAGDRPPVPGHPALGMPGGVRPIGAPAAGGSPSYGNISSFGPSGDLRDKQILPGQGADRFGIAQQRYNQFLQDSAPGDFDSIRAVGQRAGASGTLGSGMEARGFADTGRAIAQAQGSARNRFLGDALEGTIQDQANQRQEFRTERGYQGDTNQQSINNSRQAQLDSDYLTGTAFDRDYRHTGQVADIGFRNNPSGDILNAASGQQGAADQSGTDLAELLRQYAYGQSTTDPAAAQWPQPAGSIPQTTRYPTPPAPQYPQLQPRW